MKKGENCFLFLTFSCNKENNDINISKKECLKYIRQDISNGKYYPNEKNKYDYSSANYFNFLTENRELINGKKSNDPSNRDGITLDDYKNAIIEFYADKGHDANEINERFVYSETLLSQYPSFNYSEMLESYVEQNIIPSEEKDIIIDYVDYFFSQDDYETLLNVTSTYIYYVNNSDFSEFQKRGMLTIFDIFVENQRLYSANEQFSFLPLVNGNPPIPGGRPSKDTECGGRIILGIVGGAITGNGIGAVIGFGYALFEDWGSGCMD